MPFDPNKFGLAAPGATPAAPTGGFDPNNFGAPSIMGESPAPGYAGPAPEIPETQIRQEMHPDIGTMERLIVKNFSANPGATVDYLKERHPSLEFTYKKNQLLVKAPHEAEYRVLDPDNVALLGKAGFSDYLQHPGELARDIGDQAYNLGAGALSAGAATAGATAGTAAGALTAPVTGPAGPIAGGVAGGMAGGGLSAAALEALRQKIGQQLGLKQDMNGKDIALQGGIGALIPGIAGTGASKGLAGGIYNTLANKLFPKAAESASGINAETIKALKNHLPEVEAMKSTGVMPLIQDWHSRLIAGYNAAKQKVGAALEGEIANSGETVSTAPLKQVFQESLTAAEAKAKNYPNSYNKQALEDLQNQYNQLFTTAEKDSEGVIHQVAIPDEVSPQTMFELQDHLKDAAQAPSIKQGLTARYGAQASSADKALSDTALNAYRAANSELDRATNGVSTQLKDKYKELSRTRETLAPLFTSPEKAYATLSNLDKKAKQPIFETLKSLQEQHGIPLLEDAKVLQAYNAFAQPATMAQSGLGTTSTSRSIPLQALGTSLGTLLGYRATHGYAGAAVGGVMGAKLGGMAGSPAAVKTAVQLQRAFENAAGRLPPEATRAGLYGQGRNAWDSLSEQQALEEQKKKEAAQ